MKYTEATDKLIPALFKARSAMTSKAKKNTNNAHLKSKYANLESFLDAIRPALEANDLMIQQCWHEGPERNIIYLMTEVIHVSGQRLWVTSPFPMFKQDAHGVGSAITYARRYSIAGIFGIAQADDDGNATRKTSTDVVRAIEAAVSAEEATEIYRAAMDPRWFGNDSAAKRVISAAYNNKKASLVKPGEGFTPAPKVKPKEAQPEQEAPFNPEPAGNFENF